MAFLSHFESRFGTRQRCSSSAAHDARIVGDVLESAAGASSDVRISAASKNRVGEALRPLRDLACATTSSSDANIMRRPATKLLAATDDEACLTCAGVVGRLDDVGSLHDHAEERRDVIEAVLRATVADRRGGVA